jgi:hypothetical protein
MRSKGKAMVEPAGRINDRGRENDGAFAEVIAGSSPAIQELARAVRDLIYDVLPQTVEVAWPRQGSVGWGTGAKKVTEQFAYLMPFKRQSRWVSTAAENCRPARTAARCGWPAGRRHANHAQPPDHIP